jgi:hypothetical protein
LKRLTVAIAGVLLAFGGTAASGADSSVAPVSVPVASAQPAVHRVGEAFDYVIHGSMVQAITARSPLGQSVHQLGTPTQLRGSEHVSVQIVSEQGITLNRSGHIVAVVSDKSVKSAGRGRTVVRDDGSIARDTGNLGGVFLLPLPFLGDKSMNAGADLAVGAHWIDKLGTKLYGMTARPMMNFEVTSQHLMLGLDVFEIVAEGSVPMKEPVVSNTGEALGYAIGTAHVTIRGQYDHVNRRMIAMDVEVQDQLHLAGASKHAAGTVGDTQHYVVELDPASLASTTQSESMPVDAPVTH